MNRLLLIITALTTLLSANARHPKAEDNQCINDSIIRLIGDRRYISYTKGHHGHRWSIIADHDSCYRLLTGTTWDDHITIDTIVDKLPILTWGLDTLSIRATEMTPVSRDYYWPFDSQLTIVSSDKEILFDDKNYKAYAGRDSISFNTIINRLKYYMYWSASPADIQERLPQPRISTIITTSN